MGQELTNLITGIGVVVGTCVTVGTILYGVLRFIVSIQITSMIDNVVRQIDERFAMNEERHFDKLNSLETNQLQIFSKLAKHDEELKYLNKKADAIKTEAEIREITKRD